MSNGRIMFQTRRYQMQGRNVMTNRHQARIVFTQFGRQKYFQSGTVNDTRMLARIVVVNFKHVVGGATCKPRKSFRFKIRLFQELKFLKNSDWRNQMAGIILGFSKNSTAVFSSDKILSREIDKCKRKCYMRSLFDFAAFYLYINFNFFSQNIVSGS